METQSDLEVILEFLEEYYRQNSGENADKVYWTADVPVDEASCEPRWMSYESLNIKPALQTSLALDAPPALSQNTTTLSERGSLPNFVSTIQSTKHQATAAGSGRKVRLFHFLFEMLENPAMAHCVSWVPAASGVFRFSSRNKDQIAALWGQRKGNKRPMTYQKMSRALRNYARTAASERGTVMLQCRTDRAALSTTERRSMSSLYIRPESLSLLDLSLFLLSSPTKISKPYPCVLLISHHSGLRGPRGFFSATIIISLPAGLRAPTPYLASCRVTLP
ncbi:hypothetical protein PAMP_015126 [Pampus punctatissimus]